MCGPLPVSLCQRNRDNLQIVAIDKTTLPTELYLSASISRRLMPIQAPDEVLRRLCLAYPWSRECVGVDPILPTASENSALWHGASGYQYAVGRNIPNGAQCESVQLVPLDKITSRYNYSQTSSESSNPNQLFLQVPEPPVMRFVNPSMTILITESHSLLNPRRRAAALIHNDFI